MEKKKRFSGKTKITILEYCCVVWHNALPGYLSSEVEWVQMRALRIIYPRSSYQEALQRAKIARLEDRRNELCMRAFDKITKGGPLSKHLTPLRSIAHVYSFRNSNSWTSQLGFCNFPNLVNTL